MELNNSSCEFEDFVFETHFASSVCDTWYRCGDASIAPYHMNMMYDTRMLGQVTLQHDTLEGVVGGDAFYGSTIGRVCNRIAGANFSGASSSRSMAAARMAHSG